jgi:hypothetical protein
MIFLEEQIMEHYYKNVEGWMSDIHADLFREIIKKIPNDSIWVEVGSFKGRSTSFVVVESIQQNKKINFYAVDTWLGSEEHQKGAVAENEDVVNDLLFERFLENTQNIKNYFTAIRKPSIEASKDFDNNTLDVIYIDGAHDYNSVQDDINHWFPKMKKNGIVIFDDVNRKGVKKAVLEFTKKNNLTCVKKGKYIGIVYL